MLKKVILKVGFLKQYLQHHLGTFRNEKSQAHTWLTESEFLQAGPSHVL